MRGYVPPFRPIMGTRLFPGEWPIAMHGSAYTLTRMDLAVPPDCGEKSPASSAVATLVRWFVMQAGHGGWQIVDAGCIEELVYEGLRIDTTRWPISLAQVAMGLALAGNGGLARALGKEGLTVAMNGATGKAERERFPAELIVSVGKSRLCIKHAIALGHPVAVGLSVTDKWTDLRDVATGLIRTPTPMDDLTDGDCLILDGWDDDMGVFTCRFMAGSTWGANGVGYIPYEYACSPIWCHELVMIPIV